MAETEGEQLLTRIMPPDEDNYSNDVPPLVTRPYVVKFTYNKQTLITKHTHTLMQVKKVPDISKDGVPKTPPLIY